MRNREWRLMWLCRSLRLMEVFERRHFRATGVYVQGFIPLKFYSD